MKKYTYTQKIDTRSGFGAGLAELGRTNENVVALCADLVGSLKMDQFIKENPERFFQTGIAEANMMGIAAGLTIGGKIPFIRFANIDFPEPGVPIISILWFPAAAISKALFAIS